MRVYGFMCSELFSCFCSLLSPHSNERGGRPSAAGVLLPPDLRLLPAALFGLAPHLGPFTSFVLRSLTADLCGL